MKPWRHSVNDGRGSRDVYLDGKLLRNVMYADTRKGFVRVHTDEYRRRDMQPRLQTYFGKVEVEPHGNR